MNRRIVAVGSLIFAIICVAIFFAARNAPTTSAPAKSGLVQIVAAENFWGSLASQIGGTHVEVLSIVSDPNADPHEYETNTTDARAVATADYVVENGAGYDSWMDRLLGASLNQKRSVLNVAMLLGKKEGDNPHFWYDPEYVNQATARMEQDLVAFDPANAAYYESQYTTLEASLAQYQHRIATIKQRYGGTNVAATEDIFEYLANAAGLDLVSPQVFIQAVAEGNDPPAPSIVTFEDQLNGGAVHVLVYNEQTVTPLTDSMVTLAKNKGIPTVGVTETIQPASATFQDWMNAQLLALQNALNASATGR